MPHTHVDQGGIHNLSQNGWAGHIAELVPLRNQRVGPEELGSVA